MLEIILSAVVISITNLLVWKKLLNKPINFHSVKLYLGIVFMMTLLILNSIYISSLIGSLGILFIIFVTTKYIYGITNKEAIVVTIITQLLYIFSEVFVIILASLFMEIQTKHDLVEIFFDTIYANITISMVVLIVSQAPIIKKIYQFAFKLIENKKIQNILMHVIIILSIASVLFSLVYFDNSFALFLCLGLILVFVYLYFIVKNIIINNNYLHMHIKYNNTLETLKAYEDILDKYKVSNHENKNQLLMIRNMLSKDNEKDISKYIDNIVKNQYKDDENLMFETSKIPSGGLRAIIYSKLLHMKNNHVDFFLKIDKKIRTIQLSDLKEETVLEICKIIGVFIDNAIDEVMKIKKGSVGIELYLLENKLCIAISNTFEGSIDLDKISELKYTTKGNGHGYGLNLVKEIINKESRFENIKMINDDVFTQILKISI